MGRRADRELACQELPLLMDLRKRPHSSAHSYQQEQAALWKRYMYLRALPQTSSEGDILQELMSEGREGIDGGRTRQ